jgi:nucleoside 2-deoxyribosyltransferase
MNTSVYLAGPITGESYGGATDWRETVSMRLLQAGIVGLSPMRGKQYLQDVVDIADSYPAHIMSTEKAIVTRDTFDVQRCDAVLVNLLGAKRVSIGTMIEVGLAYAQRKPIVVVMEPDNIHQHAFVRQMAGYVLDNLDDAVRVTITLLGT